METAAALLPAIELLSKPTALATTKVIKFTTQFKTLALTLSSIKPVFDDVENLNRLLNRPPTETEAFTQLLSEGEQLMQRCSRIKKWDLISKWRYSNKLTEFQAKLVNFYSHVLPLLHLRESTRISVRLSDLVKHVPD